MAVAELRGVAVILDEKSRTLEAALEVVRLREQLRAEIESLAQEVFEAYANYRMGEVEIRNLWFSNPETYTEKDDRTLDWVYARWLDILRRVLRLHEEATKVAGDMGCNHIESLQRSYRTMLAAETVRSTDQLPDGLRDLARDAQSAPLIDIRELSL